MYNDDVTSTGNIFTLLGKVDGCTVELGAKVVHVCSKKDERHNEETNEHRRSLVA